MVLLKCLDYSFPSSGLIFFNNFLYLTLKYNVLWIELKFKLFIYVPFWWMVCATSILFRFFSSCLDLNSLRVIAVTCSTKTNKISGKLKFHSSQLKKDLLPWQGNKKVMKMLMIFQKIYDTRSYYSSKQVSLLTVYCEFNAFFV